MIDSTQEKNKQLLTLHGFLAVLEVPRAKTYKTERRESTLNCCIIPVILILRCLLCIQDVSLS